MLTRSKIVLLAAIALFLPLLGGCSLLMPVKSETDTVGEPFEVVITEMEPADNFADTAAAVEDDAVTEVVIPPGKSDRLPGSLNRDSINLYAAGDDFFSEGGLKTEGFGGKETEPASPGDTTPEETAPDETPADPPVYVTTEEDTVDWEVPIIEDDDDEDEWYNLD